ncbi:sugar ABC transporter substrate-binding protein [Rhodococcus aetherivorans]|uniref:sugar ABC transporter substrate-binding protein n=1 Tax=Rhodococcus aetherivorans TaxID=191292 RepID=UPI0002D21910|nr:Ribose ABC transport system, periplasmic ribose-binding protein RbsB (TC 3.A.1.2.1 [Rhodococcus aetherivorans]
MTWTVGPIRTAARTIGAAVATSVVASSAIACSTGADPVDRTGSVDPADMVMVSEVRSLTNPYEAAWVRGSQAYADSLGIDLKVIVYGGDSQNALSQLQSVLAAGKTVLLNINPNTSADTPAIVRAVQNSGGCAVTQWSKPEDLHPWDVGNGWASYVSYDGVQQGFDTGEALVDSLGGTGGVIALQGLLANEISQTRFQGFQDALGRQSGVVLLDDQPADFDRNKAYTTTQTLLNKYGDQVNGIWAATDSMALGALQAVREAGRAGEVKIASSADATPEGLDAIVRGEMVTTYTTDPYFNGAMGLAICYQALSGEIDVETLPHEKREFFVDQSLITPGNVQQFLTVPSDEEIVRSVQDPFARMAGPATS